MMLQQHRDSTDVDSPHASHHASHHAVKDALHHIRLVLTLRCEQADEVRLRHCHGEANRWEVVAEVLHRAICGTCRRSKRQAETVEEFVAEFARRERL